MGIVDTLQVGHVSDTALAAASLGGTMTWLVVVTMNGLVGALDPLTSQARPVRFYLTLVPVRPRRRCGRRSLRTLPGDSLRPHLAFNPHPRRLSTRTDAPLNSTPTSLRADRRRLSGARRERFRRGEKTSPLGRPRGVLPRRVRGVRAVHGAPALHAVRAAAAARGGGGGVLPDRSVGDASGCFISDVSVVALGDESLRAAGVRDRAQQRLERRDERRPHLRE